MGRQAQISGQTIENWVEASLKQYQIDGLAFGQRNYPEIKQKGYKAVVVGRAGPDWTVFCQGQAIQLEVKTWKAKDKHTYGLSKDRRWLQYKNLLDTIEIGRCKGYYLVAWRHPLFEFGVDWRLYEAQFVPYEEGSHSLIFEREAGVEVSCGAAGWPDWLFPITPGGILNGNR